eukprot:10259106-Alexandrium_andersonii.AAC.1
MARIRRRPAPGCKAAWGNARRRWAPVCVPVAWLSHQSRGSRGLVPADAAASAELLTAAHGSCA